MKRLITLSLLLSVVLASCAGNSDKFDLCRVDPLFKVVPGDSSFCDTADTVLVARGENATVQIVVTNTGTDTLRSLQAKVRFGSGTARTGWLHNVACYNKPWGASDMLHSSDDTFPDPIIDDAVEDLAPGERKELWIDIAIPRDAKPGLYKGKVTVAAGAEKSGKEFTVRIYPVTLPENQALTVVQWYYHGCFKAMNGGEPVPEYSELFYDCLRKIAEMAADYGQNSWLTRTPPKIILNADASDFDLDFTEFDRTIELLLRYGNMRTITFGHFGGRKPDSDWGDEFVLNGSEVVDGRISDFLTTADDPRLEKYINRYFSILKQHLDEKGWAEMFYQHIADEPAAAGTPSNESWEKVAAMIKDAAPGIHLIEASADILEHQDISVPILGESIAGYEPAPEGKERWLYTCTVPQGEYANRFIHLPLIKTRLVHWLNYRYDATGYLHWGLSWWEGSKDPMHDTTPYTDWPCGDCYIIYPGNGKVYPSIRLCAMRDGIRDYDLLKMAEAKNPAVAKEIIEDAVSGPYSYITDIEGFKNIRKKLLEFLSE